jgi:hypothetical protein
MTSKKELTKLVLKLIVVGVIYKTKKGFKKLFHLKG